MSTDLPRQPESDLSGDDDTGFDVLARRAGAALRRPAPEDGARAIAQRHRRQQALKATVVGGVAVALLIGTLAVVANRRDPTSLPPVDSSPATLPGTTAAPTPTTTALAPVVPDARVPALDKNGWVAVAAAQASGSDIYLVRPGEGARRLEVAGSDTANEVCPAWSPDGTRLLFGRVTGSSDIAFSDAELVIVPVGADGAAGAATVITLDGFDVLPGFVAHPCAVWAPDGRHVALGAGGEVWVVDTQTSAIRRLPDLRPSDLEWRPGTDQLAIAGDMGPNRAAPTVSTPITIYSVSTGELHQLGSAEAAHVTWSPEGSTLAYTGGEEGPAGLWFIDADGANQRLFVADPGQASVHGIGPVWSPAGDRIAYLRGIGCCEESEVVLVNVIDGNQTVIEPPETDGPNGQLSWLPFTVTWSPDGTTLLYRAWSVDRSGRAGPEGVLAVSADTPGDVTVVSDEIDQVEGSYESQWVPVQMWGQQPG